MSALPLKQDWLAFCRDLVQNWTEEFTAADLAASVEHKLAPEVFNWKHPANVDKKHDEVLRARGLWRLENPGTSTGNMRRICEQLVAEGVLTRR